MAALATADKDPLECYATSSTNVATVSIGFAALASMRRMMGYNGIREKNLLCEHPAMILLVG